MVALLAVTIKHERRARLVFDSPLAGAAYTSTAFYAVTELDGLAANPGVVKALVVTSSPQVVELQLDTDLVQGARYSFSAVGVPALDASTTPDPSAVTATVGREPAAAALGAIGPVTDLELTLFGEDLVLDGDFGETPDGDLDTVGGLRCATLDLQRAAESNGLPWDPSHGLHAREQVDGHPQGLQALRGRAVEMMLRDDRVVSASAEVDFSDTEAPTLILRPTWIGARGAQQTPVRARFASER